MGETWAAIALCTFNILCGFVLIYLETHRLIARNRRRAARKQEESDERE